MNRITLTLCLLLALPTPAFAGAFGDLVQEVKSKAKTEKKEDKKQGQRAGGEKDAAFAQRCGAAARGLADLAESLPNDPDQVWRSRLDDILALQEHAAVTEYFAVEEVVAADARGSARCGAAYEELQAAMAALQTHGPTFGKAVSPLLTEARRVYGFPDLPSATAYAQKAAALAAVALWLAEDDPDVQARQAEADATLAQYRSEYAKGLSGAFHAEHVGELFLASSAVNLGSEDPATFGDRWVVGAPTWVAAYYQGALDQMAGNNTGGARMELRLYEASDTYRQSAKLKYAWTVDSAAATKATALTVELWPASPTAAKQPGLATKFGEYVLSLPPGEHGYFLQLSATDPRDGGRTTGKFEGPIAGIVIEVPADPSAARAALSTIRSTWVASQRMPKAGRTDSALQAQMTRAYTEAGWKEKPLRAVVVDSDWTLFRDDWDRVVSRTTLGAVAVDPGTGECVVYRGVFQQDAVGGGKWSSATLQLITDDAPITCANVGK